MRISSTREDIIHQKPCLTQFLSESGVDSPIYPHTLGSYDDVRCVWEHTTLVEVRMGLLTNLRDSISRVTDGLLTDSEQKRIWIYGQPNA